MKMSIYVTPEWKAFMAAEAAKSRRSMSQEIMWRCAEWCMAKDTQTPYIHHTSTTVTPYIHHTNTVPDELLTYWATLFPSVSLTPEQMQEWLDKLNGDVDELKRLLDYAKDKAKSRGNGLIKYVNLSVQTAVTKRSAQPSQVTGTQKGEDGKELPNDADRARWAAVDKWLETHPNPWPVDEDEDE